METSDKFNKQETLCWYCSNAVPNPKTGKGCSWSKEFKPVEGWVAEKTLIVTRAEGERPIPSYIVYDCPLFDRDTKQFQTLEKTIK